MKQSRNWIEEPITMEECRLLHVIAQGDEQGNKVWEIKTEQEKAEFLLMTREAIKKHFDPSSMEFRN